MEGYPGGMMGLGPGMMMPPNMMGMDLPFPGPVSPSKNKDLKNAVSMRYMQRT